MPHSWATSTVAELGIGMLAVGVLVWISYTEGPRVAHSLSRGILWSHPTWSRGL